MGLFLALTGIAGVTTEQVEKALPEYARDKGRTFCAGAPGTRPEELMVIAESSGQNVTVMYPAHFLEWDDASARLSRVLQKPAFSFHIHDGDLWMYMFFVDGEETDRFNPIPEYWGEISAEEMRTWSGNPQTLCRHWPRLQVEQIEKYLVHWSLDDVGQQEHKAYPDDEFCAGQDCQLCDFMSKLGLIYPVDNNGNRMGKTYAFTTDEPYPGSRTTPPRKPWWRVW